MTSFSPLWDLFNLSTSSLVDPDPMFEKLGRIFTNLEELLGFKSVDDMRAFFDPVDFDTVKEVQTVYGSIKYCPVSKKLFSAYFKEHLSLASFCAFRLSRMVSVSDALEVLFLMPVNFVSAVRAVSLQFVS